MEDGELRDAFSLSSILYLKVPPVISEKKDVPHGGSPHLHMASGNCDGFTQLVWGATGMRDFSLLRPPSKRRLRKRWQHLPRNQKRKSVKKGTQLPVQSPLNLPLRA